MKVDYELSKGSFFDYGPGAKPIEKGSVFIVCYGEIAPNTDSRGPLYVVTDFGYVSLRSGEVASELMYGIKLYVFSVLVLRT